MLLILLQVQRGSAGDLISSWIGVISCAVAVTSLTVFALKRSGRNRTLMWFGVFAAIYGIRILISSDVFRAVFHVDGYAASTVSLAITYIIQLPAMLFALDLIDAMGTRLSKLMFVVAALLAVVGCASLVSGVGLRWMPLVNNFFVIAFFLPTYVWAYSRSSRAGGLHWIKVGFFLFVISVIYDNLSGFGLVRGLGLEPYGFLVLLAAMGAVTAQKTLDSEQRLVAMERELEIARNIQQSILPEKVPSKSGIEIAVRYLPMRQVAGDFYDFVELEDGRVGVLVADVSGHGVPAALIASMLKMAFVSHAPVAGDPAQMLAKLNSALCGRFSSHFVTAVYVVLNRTAGTMSYSAAAHPAMLVRRRDGRIEELSQNGLMLGAFEFAQYENATTQIAVGDQVLLYTDGLAEGSNKADEEFGVERLKGCFDGAASLSLEQLFAKTSAWTAQTPQQDDLTAVVIGIA